MVALYQRRNHGAGCGSRDRRRTSKYRGKLGGKIVFLGAPWEVKPVDKPLYKTYDEADLKKIEEYPLKPPSQEWRKDYMKRLDLRNKIDYSHG